jgi:tyrosinase
MAATTLAGAVRLLVAVVLLCLFPADSTAIGYHGKVHARTPMKTLSRRQNTTEDIVPVLGLPGLGVTTTYPRLEIRELQRRPDEFNVYLLGLRRFHNTSQDDKMSYFQIAGM